MKERSARAHPFHLQGFLQADRRRTVTLDVGERRAVMVEMSQPVGNGWLRANTLDAGGPVVSVSRLRPAWALAAHRVFSAKFATLTGCLA
jgi:hypothetical protein